MMALLIEENLNLIVEKRGSLKIFLEMEILFTEENLNKFNEVLTEITTPYLDCSYGFYKLLTDCLKIIST